MDPENQIAHLKKLIAQNEKALGEMKAIVADLEGRRCESMERHKQGLNGKGHPGSGFSPDPFRPTN